MPGLLSGVGVSSLPTESMITEAWLRSPISVERSSASAAAPAGRCPQHRIGVVDRWLCPDHDPGGVERVEQPRAEQVMGAGDVRAYRAQLGDDRVDVAVRQRRACALEVLVDRCAAQPHSPAVEVQHAAAYEHAAHPGSERLGLFDPACGDDVDLHVVQRRVLGRPQHDRASHGDPEADRGRSAGGELCELLSVVATAPPPGAVTWRTISPRSGSAEVFLSVPCTRMAPQR